MLIQINEKILKVDINNLKNHMEQCQKEQCYQKMIINAVKMSYRFFRERTITNLTGVAVIGVIILLIVN